MVKLHHGKLKPFVTFAPLRRSCGETTPTSPAAASISQFDVTKFHVLITINNNNALTYLSSSFAPPSPTHPATRPTPIAPKPIARSASQPTTLPRLLPSPTCPRQTPFLALPPAGRMLHYKKTPKRRSTDEKCRRQTGRMCGAAARSGGRSQ